MSVVSMSDELVFKEYQFKCHSLKSEKTRMLLVRQNLLVLNEKNESMSKRLLNIETHCKLYRSHLYKSLLDQKVATDKQKISSRKKLDEFLQSKKRTKEYYKMSPIWFELESIMKKNTILEEECRKQTHLLKLTKQQFKELLNLLKETFQKKVCELCHKIVKHDFLDFEMSKCQLEMSRKQ